MTPVDVDTIQTVARAASSYVLKSPKLSAAPAAPMSPVLSPGRSHFHPISIDIPLSPKSPHRGSIGSLENARSPQRFRSGSMSAILPLGQHVQGSPKLSHTGSMDNIRSPKQLLGEWARRTRTLGGGGGGGGGGSSAGSRYRR